MKHIIQVEQLNALKKEQNVVIIDARADLQDKAWGKNLYEVSHIPGAYFLDLEKDLSSEVEQHGGNHPLPDMQALARKLGRFGITKDKKVVVYGTGNDMFAARAWWLIRYAGHMQTYVLDGGISAWEKAGYETTSQIPAEQNTTFNLNLQEDWTRSMKEVGARGSSVLIDSRAYERYVGNIEPLYHKAGHIPGAKNYFWKDVLDEAGHWKNTSQLVEHFSNLDKDKEVIVSCGSGVSACQNIIALLEAGFTNVKLYPGSYSDWISYEENAVHKGVDTN